MLQPLLHLDHYYHESYKQLVRIVFNHAKTGMDLLTRYKQIYTNFYLTPLHLFCLVDLSDAMVRYDDHRDAILETVEFCFTSLEEAKVGYPVAGPLQKMFRLSLTEYRVPVSDRLERMIGGASRLGPEELLDACTRPTYRQPIQQLMPGIKADLGQDFMDGWQHLAETQSAALPLGESPGSISDEIGTRMDIGSLLNM